MKILKNIILFLILLINGLLITNQSFAGESIVGRGNPNFYYFADFSVVSDTWAERQNVPAFTPQRICQPYSLAKNNASEMVGKIGKGIKPNLQGSLIPNLPIKLGKTYSINMRVDFTPANRPSNASGRWTLVAKDGGGRHHIIINISSGQIGLYSGAFYSSAYDIRPLTGWNMVTMVSDGTKNMIYINGNKVGSDINTIIDTDVNPIGVFGNYTTINGNQTSMPFDEVSLYNNNLNLSEIQKLYNSGSGIDTNDLNVGGLQYYYSFEEENATLKALNTNPTHLGYNGDQGCILRFPEGWGRAFEYNSSQWFDSNVYRYITMVYKLREGTTMGNLLREVNSSGGGAVWRSLVGNQKGSPTSYLEMGKWGGLIDDNRRHIKTIQLPVGKFYDALIFHGDPGFIDTTSIGGGTYGQNGHQGEFFLGGMYIHKNVSDVDFLKIKEDNSCNFNDQSSTKIIDGKTCDLTGKKITFNNNISLKNGASILLDSGSVLNINGNNSINIDDTSKVVTKNGGILQVNNSLIKGICGVANNLSTANITSKSNTELCSVGTATISDGGGTDGRFNWSCLGETGGTPVMCIAPIQNADYTLKLFTIDDRISNGFILNSANGGNSVSGGYWHANVTDGQGELNKDYLTGIKTGSKMKLGGYVANAYWGNRVQLIMKDKANASNYFLVKLERSSYSGVSAFQIYHNGTLVNSYGISGLAIYNIELEKTDTGFIGRLFAADGTTLLNSFNQISSNILNSIQFQIGTTTNEMPAIQYTESNIYY